MTDTPPSPVDRAEQAATRRRWIGLAEFVAVAGLLIGALTLYLNWADRREERTEQTDARAAEDRAAGISTLTATIVDDGNELALADADRALSGASVRFPAALGVGEQDAMPGPAIDSTWFADALLARTDGGADARDGRLPVLITTQWWDGATRRQDRAIYDILWRTDGRLLQGRRLRLTGLVLRERDATAAALDRMALP